MQGLLRPIRTASVATLGCKLNQAGSYRVQVELARAGVELVGASIRGTIEPPRG